MQRGTSGATDSAIRCDPRRDVGLAGGLRCWGGSWVGLCACLRASRGVLGHTTPRGGSEASVSHVATAWAYRQKIKVSGRKFVLVALADFADEAWTCFPGQERLAAMTGQDVRSVRRHMIELERDGLIERKSRFLANGQRTSDRYQLKAAVEDIQEAIGPPDIMTGGQDDLRSITAGTPDRLSGDPLENHQSYPLTPSELGGSCNPDSPIHTDCRACGTSRRALARAAKNAKPAWCGDCDEKTRMRDLDADAPYRCPDCHPLAERKTA